MFVILGATGKVGRTTAAALRAAGAPVRAVVRDRAKADRLAALGCEIAVADMNDSVALVRAMSGASAIQVICPVNPRAMDAVGEMTATIDRLGDALAATGPDRVLAISDYGAEVEAGTGVTMLFHILEARLRRLSSRVIFLRSAEHMQNWARVVGAARTGVLPSLHHPVTKRFPTVSAFDVGGIAAELLLSDGAPEIVHAEGPRRYTAEDVAAAMGVLLRHEVVACESPRADWAATLRRGGLSESYLGLVSELYDAHNAGRIDAQPGVGEIRRGPTELIDALRPIVQAA